MSACGGCGRRVLWDRVACRSTSGPQNERLCIAKTWAAPTNRPRRSTPSQQTLYTALPISRTFSLQVGGFVSVYVRIEGCIS
jgi:hypothetical protein